MFYNILDQKRQDLLPLLKPLKGQFYLAGGTALALQIGHRDSVDFDFFTNSNIDTKALFSQLQEIFNKYDLIKVNEDENTLDVSVDGVSLSFLTLKAKLLQPPTEEPHLRIASIADISCMKLSAIIGRTSSKDYFDIYFLLDHLQLSEILDLTSKKFPELDQNIVIKGLMFFDDVDQDHVDLIGSDVPWNDVVTRIQESVREL